MKPFRFLLFALLLSFFSNQLNAQDSTRYEVFDVVHLKDGRVLKGQILSYDSQLGGISFKDIHGRVYNFSRDDYKFFQEKQSFPVRTKKAKAPLRERKSNGIRYTIGLNVSHFIGLETVEADNLSSRRRSTGSTLGVYGIVGKYFTRNHYVGAVVEIGALSADPRFFNFGARYNYEYDLKKTNVAKFIPVEIKYQNIILTNSGIPYTDVTPNSIISGFYYPKTEFQSILFSVGHGFGFILKNGGSFNLELSYQRHITLNQKFYELRPDDVEGYNPKFQINGFRLGCSLSF